MVVSVDARDPRPFVEEDERRLRLKFHRLTGTPLGQVSMAMATVMQGRGGGEGGLTVSLMSWLCPVDGGWRHASGAVGGRREDAEGED